MLKLQGLMCGGLNSIYYLLGASPVIQIHLQCRKHGFNPWVGKMPWRRKLQRTPVFLPGKSHRQRSLAGYSPWGHKESDTTERLTPSLSSGGSLPTLLRLLSILRLLSTREILLRQLVSSNKDPRALGLK